MKKLTLTITGTAPLLMHNARLADPLDPAAKALARLTAKRSKTEDDHLEIAQVEHAGGLYLDPDVGPYLPGDNIWRCLYDAAKKHKLGEKVKAGLMVDTIVNPLSYTGPRDAAGLWADAAFRYRSSAKVMGRRVIRNRPIFREWATSADLVIDPNVFDDQQIRTIVETAGAYIGLGDWRPRFGQFTGRLS